MSGSHSPVTLGSWGLRPSRSLPHAICLSHRVRASASVLRDYRTVKRDIEVPCSPTTCRRAATSADERLRLNVQGESDHVATIGESLPD